MRLLPPQLYARVSTDNQNLELGAHWQCSSTTIREHSVKEICETMSVSQSTLYKYVKATGAGDALSRP